MLNLQLHLQPETEHRLQQIFRWMPDEEIFAQHLIAYQLAELKKAQWNLQLDLRQLENRYQMTTDEFYQQFQTGQLADSEDFLVWAGLVEMLAQTEKHWRELQ
jgi:transcriptional regulator of heat shock response